MKNNITKNEKKHYRYSSNIPILILSKVFIKDWSVVVTNPRSACVSDHEFEPIKPLKTNKV
jgi:hypothetical protein